MEFLISEQQLKVLLKEGSKSKMTESLKSMYSFTNNLVTRMMKVYNINLKMLLTWGTSVAGLMMPLDNYIKDKGFNLTDDQRMLVLSGVVFILFFEGKKGLGRILNEIDENGLEIDFKKILQKGSELKFAFFQFMQVMKITTATFMEVVAYCFLIPIIPDIFEMAHNSKDIKETTLLITERLLATGLVLISREALITLVRKLLRKFK